MEGGGWRVEGEGWRLEGEPPEVVSHAGTAVSHASPMKLHSPLKLRWSWTLLDHPLWPTYALVRVSAAETNRNSPAHIQGDGGGRRHSPCSVLRKCQLRGSLQDCQVEGRPMCFHTINSVGFAVAAELCEARKFHVWRADGGQWRR